MSVLTSLLIEIFSRHEQLFICVWTCFVYFFSVCIRKCVFKHVLNDYHRILWPQKKKCCMIVQSDSLWNTNEWVLVFAELQKIIFNCIGSVMVSVLVLNASVGANLRLLTLLMPRRHVSSKNRMPMRHICRLVVTCQDDICHLSKSQSYEL